MSNETIRAHALACRHLATQLEAHKGDIAEADSTLLPLARETISHLEYLAGELYLRVDPEADDTAPTPDTFAPRASDPPLLAELRRLAGQDLPRASAGAGR